jgi:hypothetical protein
MFGIKAGESPRSRGNLRICRQKEGDESGQKNDGALEKKGLSDAGWGLGTRAGHRNPGEGGGDGNGKYGRKSERGGKVPVFPVDP